MIVLLGGAGVGCWAKAVGAKQTASKVTRSRVRMRFILGGIIAGELKRKPGIAAGLSSNHWSEAN
jgi:hypothetical protein